MKYIMITLFLILPSMAFALGETESMRCNNGIVSPGNTTDELIEKCGLPAARRGMTRGYTYAGKRYYGEEWIYDFGPQEFVYIALVDGRRVNLLFSTREHGKRRN